LGTLIVRRNPLQSAKHTEEANDRTSWGDRSLPRHAPKDVRSFPPTPHTSTSANVRPSLGDRSPSRRRHVTYLGHPFPLLPPHFHLMPSKSSCTFCHFHLHNSQTTTTTNLSLSPPLTPPPATTHHRRPLHSPPSPLFHINPAHFPHFLPNLHNPPTSHKILIFFFFIFDNCTLLYKSVVPSVLVSLLLQGVGNFWRLVFTSWFEGCTPPARQKSSTDLQDA
jgi:hypothetical protein